MVLRSGRCGCVNVFNAQSFLAQESNWADTAYVLKNLILVADWLEDIIAIHKGLDTAGLQVRGSSKSL